MKLQLDKSKPLCPQLAEALCVEIAKGNIPPGEKLMSVRELALTVGVNPNTVQKTCELLEQRGVLYSVRGSGWFVGDDITPAVDMVAEVKYTKTDQYFADMAALGFSQEETKEYIKEWEE